MRVFKYILCACTLLIIVVPVNSQDLNIQWGDTIYTDLDSKLEGNIFVVLKEDLKTGKYNIFYDSSLKTLAAKGNIQNGKKVGLWMEYYENGQPKNLCNYSGSDGQRHGLYTFWKENGIKTLEAFYKNGQLDGLYQEWDTIGNLYLVGNYSLGKEEGSWKYYYPDLNISKIDIFNQGIYIDSSVCYFANGNIMSIKYYNIENNRPVILLYPCEEVSFDVNESKLIIESKENCTLIPEYLFYESGTPKKTFQINQNDTIQIEYYEDGTIKSLGGFSYRIVDLNGFRFEVKNFDQFLPGDLFRKINSEIVALKSDDVINLHMKREYCKTGKWEYYDVKKRLVKTEKYNNGKILN